MVNPCKQGIFRVVLGDSLIVALPQNKSLIELVVSSHICWELC